MSGSYPNITVVGRRTNRSGPLANACPTIGGEGGRGSWDPVRGPPSVICPYTIDAFGDSLGIVQDYAAVFGTSDQGYNTALMPQWCTRRSVANGACPIDPTTGKRIQLCTKLVDSTPGGAYCADWAAQNPNEATIALRQYCQLHPTDECGCLSSESSVDVVSCLANYAKTGAVVPGGKIAPLVPSKGGGGGGGSNTKKYIEIVLGLLAFCLLLAAAIYGVSLFRSRRKGGAMAPGGVVVAAPMPIPMPTPIVVQRV